PPLRCVGSPVSSPTGAADWPGASSASRPPAAEPGRGSLSHLTQVATTTAAELGRVAVPGRGHRRVEAGPTGTGAGCAARHGRLVRGARAGGLSLLVRSRLTHPARPAGRRQRLAHDASGVVLTGVK